MRQVPIQTEQVQEIVKKLRAQIEKQILYEGQGSLRQIAQQEGRVQESQGSPGREKQGQQP